MAKTFIVDASTACDAGTKDPPTERGLLARAFLDALRDAGHSLALTPALVQEWENHAGRMARRWLVTMYARRRVRHIATGNTQALRVGALKTAPTPNIRAEMTKDWHLLDAALGTDRTIASSDDLARGWYAHAATVVRGLRLIVWVNPSTSDLSAWLHTGAPADTTKQLGAD